ncbi:hypothetical protein [Phenylobacterium sp.]|uniref:hypothetical protein n=1 Tax=Phenylobacterium sp. TaxID=1871053 RepID=UPI0026213C18|nr:hypothetical protein [Phenylobacterium sp.]
MSEHDVDKARAEYSAAKLALSQLESEVATKARAAADAVKAEYADRVRAASLARRAAHVALNAAITATAQHPWEGRRVFRLDPRGAVYGRRAPTRVEGVVEVRRTGTAFPGNAATYSMPEMGDAFVRLLKKDGTPGAKFDRLHTGRSFPWKLVDDGEPLSASPSPPPNSPGFEPSRR